MDANDLSHGDALSWCLAQKHNVSLAAAAGAFSASLVTRDLAQRALLGAVAVMTHVDTHDFVLSKYAGGYCAICGIEEEVDLDNARRWFSEIGGAPAVPKNLIASALVLESTTPDFDDERRREGVAILDDALDAVEALADDATLSALRAALIGKFKSNKRERQTTLETLGYVGVLCPADQDDYLTRFIGFEERERRQPAHFYSKEWEYPVQHWNGRVGVDRAAFERVFGG